MTKSLDEQTWNVVCAMETPLWTVHDLLTAIGLMASTDLEGDDAIASLQRIITLAQDAWKDAEDKRGQLFRMNHPRRNDPDVIAACQEDAR